jgi:DNA-directed RNA polymerase specialized sigma24 family protein
MATNEDNHYVDNKRLYAEMVIYTEKYKQAIAAGLEPPRANDYIGKCIWLIANRLSTNRNFIGYTYREDMVGDAIENCFRYLHNFDPEKSTNPFAYFTQIMYYAFLRRIDKEKKQSYIKYKSMENSLVMNTLVEMAPDDQSHFNAFMVTMDMDKLSALSEKYEAKATTKATKKKGLEKFFGDEDESL